MSLHAWAQRFADELALLLFAQIRLRPPSLRQRRRRKVGPRDWPARFATRQEWLAWREEDREDERQELMGEFYGGFIDAAILEARLPPMADLDEDVPILIQKKAA